MIWMVRRTMFVSGSLLEQLRRTGFESLCDEVGVTGCERWHFGVSHGRNSATLAVKTKLNHFNDNACVYKPGCPQPSSSTFSLE